jgi:rubredoxin
VTKVLVRCDHCGYSWRLPLQQPIIGAVNGDTIIFAPCSIDVKCPECGTQGVNYTEITADVTDESIRGLFALLRSASLTDEDVEKLATIASDARKSDTKPEALVELIKTSIPRLRPVLAWINSQGSGSVAGWIGVLLALVMLIITVKGQATAPVQRPTIIIECPSGEEQQISDLFGQIADELRSALKASNTAVGPQVEPRPKNPPDGHLSSQP